MFSNVLPLSIAVPGARFYKNFKAPGGVDYFDNRGSISFNASKYIDMQLGYDKNFIGDGFAVCS